MNMILANINENEDDSVANNVIEEEKVEKSPSKTNQSPENIVINALFQFITILTTYDLAQNPQKQKLLKTLKYIPSIDYF